MLDTSRARTQAREATPATPDQASPALPGEPGSDSRPGSDGKSDRPGERTERGLPRDPGDANEIDPADEPARVAPAYERGPAARAAGADRWGDLPPHVRDLFRMEGGGDLPPRYRDWIDAYYRRLDRTP